MEGQSDRSRKVWALARRQHGVVSRRQLLALGYSNKAIDHRIASGRLHVKARGVFAVGRPELSRLGELMVAVLACAPGAVISHETAAELWARGGQRRARSRCRSRAGRATAARGWWCIEGSASPRRIIGACR